MKRITKEENRQKVVDGESYFDYDETTDTVDFYTGSTLTEASIVCTKIMELRNRKVSTQ